MLRASVGVAEAQLLDMYPGEVRVAEQGRFYGRHRLLSMLPGQPSATATPRAVALMVGMLKLRQPRHGEACAVTDSGGAIWHLTGGFVVTLEFDEDGSAMWHLDLDREDDPPAATSKEGQRTER